MGREAPACLAILLPSRDVDTRIPQPTQWRLSHLGTMLADGTRAALSRAGGDGCVWSQSLRPSLASVLCGELAALRVDTC